MSKHTPGPWSWDDSYQCRDLSDTFSLIGRDGFGILSCDGMGNSPQNVNKADADLIAAAPDLLEALEMAVAEYEKLPHSLGYEFTHLPPMRAAIAKAKGEQA